MELYFPAKFTVLFEAKFAFSFCIHINFISVCNVILVFTDRTN